MERTIVGLDTESISPIASDSPAPAREVRPHPDHGDVVSGARLVRKTPDRAGLFVGSRSEFAAALLRVLAPAGAFEELIARRLVAAAWRLNRCALTAESRTAGSAPSGANRRRRIARAERRLLRLLSILEKLQRFRLGRWGRAVPEGGPAPPATLAPDDLPPVPTRLDELGWARRFDPKDRDDEPPAATAVGPEPDDISALWRDRLALDPGVSEDSPVVKGTWVTVGQIVSLVVDGWSWADILRSHPELTEADIRACLAYCSEVEGGSLGFD